MKRPLRVGLVLATAAAGCAPHQPRLPEGRYVEAVRIFAENVLRHGRDTYGPQRTPLFIDGINVDTYEPPVWTVAEEYAREQKMPREWVPSNLASQQVLFRTLVGLSNVTRDPRYRRAAEAAVRYAFDRLQVENGLLHWGGHSMYDALHDEPVGEYRVEGRAGKHEIKTHYPFYELMWDVDPRATRRFLEGLWECHVLRWDILDTNRHGSYTQPPPGPDLWDRAYAGGPMPFIGKGLTFFCSGSDLMAGAAFLHERTGDGRPLEWALRLGSRYDEVRNPETGLAADSYSEETKRRFVQQFGAEFGERLTEASIVNIYGSRHGNGAVGQLKLAERLGPKGAKFREWTLRDLTAFAKHAYDPADNGIWVLINDGTKVGPDDVKREGYMTPDSFRKRTAGAEHFWAYALAWRLSKDPLMWETARSIARALGLGDYGPDAGRPSAPDLETGHVSDEAVFALLELHKATGARAYLNVARRVGDNLLKRHFHRGFFVADANRLFAKFDIPTPLALLHLDAALGNPRGDVPDYTGGISFFHGPHEGAGRTYDGAMLYSRTRK